MKQLKAKPTDEEMLQVYALFKQASVGDVNTGRTAPRGAHATPPEAPTPAGARLTALMCVCSSSWDAGLHWKSQVGRLGEAER